MSGHIDFSVFPNLPTEIRATIWTMCFASRPGRVVEVRNREVHHREIDDFDSNGKPRLFLWSPSPSPEIVNVCHEARDTAKRVAMSAGQFHFQGIYFDPAIDTLYLPKIDRGRPALQNEEENLSEIYHNTILNQLATAIRLEDVCFYARDMEFSTLGLGSDLRLLTQLKTITFVVPGYYARHTRYHKRYFQHARRMLSSLMALEAVRARKAGEDVHCPEAKVYLLAVRNGGKFTVVESVE